MLHVLVARRRGRHQIAQNLRVHALRIGERAGVTPPRVGGRLSRVLESLGLPTDLDAEPLRAAMRWIPLDKKRKDGAVRVILLRDIGEPVIQRMTMETLTELVLGM